MNSFPEGMSDALKMLYADRPWPHQMNTAATMGHVAHVVHLLGQLAVHATLRPFLNLPPVFNRGPFPNVTNPGPPLHVAINNGHADVVDHLVACPWIHLDVLDEFDQPPLHRAATLNNPQHAAARMVEALLNAGADPRVRAVHAWNLPGGTNLSLAQAAVYWAEGNAGAILEVLHRRGLIDPAADPEHLLHIAAQAQSPEEDREPGNVRSAVAWLIEHGASPVLPNAQGQNVLDLAHELRQTSPATFALIERAVLSAQPCEPVRPLHETPNDALDRTLAGGRRRL